VAQGLRSISCHSAPVKLNIAVHAMQSGEETAFLRNGIISSVFCDSNPIR
jgi:hypothetical protein